MGILPQLYHLLGPSKQLNLQSVVSIANTISSYLIVLFSVDHWVQEHGLTYTLQTTHPLMVKRLTELICHD
jgi:hypothetical protein